MAAIKIGFLPLYVKLYDDIKPDFRKPLVPYAKKAEDRLKEQGFEVVASPICCVADEFNAAVNAFNAADVDAIVTLHLAYSPSLESIDALRKAKAPIVVLDSTLTPDFATQNSGANIMTDHGIHGVQDMTCLLRKYKVPYFVEAGHIDLSDVIERVANVVRGCAAAKKLTGMKVGIIGEPFAGMGDFRISAKELKNYFDIDLVEFDFSKIPALSAEITDKMIDAEIEKDKQNFEVVADVDDDYIQSVKTNLIIQNWVKENGLSAFTFNFLAVTKKSGLPRVPFMAASKSMAEGIGYAGEGDVMTAALVGALLHSFKEVSFCEMFCPCWEENAIFLSHMGEMNLALCNKKPTVLKMSYNYTDCGDPVFAAGEFKPGKAIFFNLSPRADGFDLIIAPIELFDNDVNDNMSHKVRGWFRPEMPIADFLKKYSEAGGTHHAGFIYNASADALVAFARLIGANPVVIK